MLFKSVEERHITRSINITTSGRNLQGGANLYLLKRKKHQSQLTGRTKTDVKYKEPFREK